MNAKFRSHLESDVAQELNDMGVEWTYEERVTHPNAASLPYLPDFTIKQSPNELRLPRWVEVKPQPFLYDLRDALKITRKYGEYFKGEVTQECDYLFLRSRHSELWKPKRLAELTGESVLVVGGVLGTARLSIELRPNDIVFSREHPFVNWTGVQRKREREQREQRWRVEQEARARWCAQVEAQRLEAEAQRRRAALQAATPGRQRGANRHDAGCDGCGKRVWAGMGSLYAVDNPGGATRWLVICDDCRCRMGRCA